MTITSSELTRKHCVPCEGGIPPLSAEEVRAHLQAVPGWQVTEDGKRIRREWKVKNFVSGLEFFQKVGQIAEAEGHHPDLHLTGYRNVAVEIYTHAVGGLTENDFILAARIDEVPVAAKG
jgi:4a-hydroxytetrahydrobiopterin dehydratase